MKYVDRNYLINFNNLWSRSLEMLLNFNEECKESKRAIDSVLSGDKFEASDFKKKKRKICSALTNVWHCILSLYFLKLNPFTLLGVDMDIALKSNRRESGYVKFLDQRIFDLVSILSSKLGALCLKQLLDIGKVKYLNVSGVNVLSFYEKALYFSKNFIQEFNEVLFDCLCLDVVEKGTVNKCGPECKYNIYNCIWIYKDDFLSADEIDSLYKCGFKFSSRDECNFIVRENKFASNNSNQKVAIDMKIKQASSERSVYENDIKNVSKNGEVINGNRVEGKNSNKRNSLKSYLSRIGDGIKYVKKRIKHNRAERFRSISP